MLNHTQHIVKEKLNTSQMTVVEQPSIIENMSSKSLEKIDLEYLREIMKATKRNQSDLARLLGRDKSVITNLFNGERGISIEEAKKISREWGGSSIKLLMLEDDVLNLQRNEKFLDQELFQFAKRTTIGILRSRFQVAEDYFDVFQQVYDLAAQERARGNSLDEVSVTVTWMDLYDSKKSAAGAH